jgi:hypothetical protein
MVQEDKMTDRFEALLNDGEGEAPSAQMNPSGDQALDVAPAACCGWPPMKVS